MDNTPKLAVSPSEAARMIGVSLRTLQNYIRVKQLPVRKIGRRTVVRFIPLHSLDKKNTCTISVRTAQSNAVAAEVHFERKPREDKAIPV